MKKYKLKKARPRGKLYRLEIVATCTDPPQDTSALIEGPVNIIAKKGMYFGRLYPVKEATK